MNGKRRWRSWISLLLAAVMTVQLLPVSVMAAEVDMGTMVADVGTDATTVASGNCGVRDAESGTNADNATWVLTPDGTLTISGTGTVDYTSAWNTLANQIKSVVIGEGITGISSANGWGNAKTLSLPASLTSFDPEIITNCSALESITLAEGSGTYKLVDGALLSKDGTVLHWYPRNASDATAYDVPRGVKTIGDYALYGHRNLRTITLPDGLVTIGDHAFNSCGNLNCTLTIPSTVKVMGEYCLSYNNELKIIIPADSVLETIGEGAMSDNYTDELTLPATLKSVGARSLPFGLKGGAVLTFLSRTVELADNAMWEGTTVYGYRNSTVEAYAKKVNNSKIVNFIPLDADDPDLSGLGKTIGFLPGLVDSPVPNYATEINGAIEKSMGFVDEKAGISLVSGSVKDKKDAVLTKLSFTMQLQAHLIDSEQAIPQPTFALSSAKDVGTTLSVNETTTNEQLASGARWYTVTVENGSFADGEIVLTCAYDPGLLGWYSTYLENVQAVYAYADGSKTGSEVQPAKVATNSYFTIDRFQVGDGTAVEIVPGGLNTADGAASLFAGGWQRGGLSTTDSDGRPVIYQTMDQPATVSLKLTPGAAQNFYSKTTVKCYLSDSADNYASGQLLKETSFTAGDELYSMESLVKAHPIQLTLPRQGMNTVKCLTAEVTTHYALNGKSGTVVKTHTVLISTLRTNGELYSVSDDGVLNGYRGSESTMTLPWVANNTRVKTVGPLASGNQYGTREVVVSSGIEALAADALKNFRDLTTVRLPDTIKTIGARSLATGSPELTLRIDSADTERPTFAEDVVDPNVTKLTVQCYRGSAAEAWANVLKERYPSRVTVETLDESRMLRIEVNNTAGQTLGRESFTSVEWFREGDDTLLDNGISYTLPSNAVIDETHRYVCKVTFTAATRFNYTVPVTMNFTFDSFGTQSYQLPPREKNITVKGSFRQDQIDSGFEAYLVVQEPDGDLTVNLSSITKTNPSFSVPLSGRYPTTLYAQNGKGGKLVMTDVQSRTATDGVVDFGTLKLPNRNIRQTIQSTEVDSLHANALNALVSHPGGFVLVDEAGEEFTDFTLSVKSSAYNSTCWLVLKLGDSALGKYSVGDKLTLHQIADETIHYRIPDMEITLQLKTAQATKFPLTVGTAPQIYLYNANRNDYYVFDEVGTLVRDRPQGSVYLDPGTYTVIGLQKNNFITSISSLTELERLGIPEENYLKETVFLNKDTVHRISRVPSFLPNTITLTATADEQMMANGLVPVYIQYHNQLMDQYGLEQEWTISVNTCDRVTFDASLPLAQLEGKYAYSTDGTIVSESISQTGGGYYYQQLDLTVRDAAGTICLYAQATGRKLTIQAAEVGTATTLVLPRESISLSAPESATAQAEGTLHLYAQLPQSSGTTYSGRVYVDNTFQGEKNLSVSGSGENLLPYRLKRYSDGSASHSVRVEVWKTTGAAEERIWSSDEYHILLLPTGGEAAQPEKLSMRMFMAREGYRGNLQLTKNFDLQSGSYGKISYTLYPEDFNADNTLKNDTVLDYQLTMTNPERVRNGRVILRVYSGSESSPTITDLILRQNPTTGTFDGTLTLEGGTYGISDMPFGYDLRYYSDTEMSASMEQLAEQIKQREEAIRSDVPEDCMAPKEPVDMEALEVYLQQLPEGTGEGEFTAEEKQHLRDLCILHNEWCQSMEESRAAMSEVFETVTGTGIENWDDLTTQDILNLVAELSGGLAPEVLEAGSELLNREYLLSHGYLQAGDTGVYVYEDATSGYISVVDLNAGVHISAGEMPQRTRAFERIDAVEVYAEISSAMQTLLMVLDLTTKASVEILDHIMDYLIEFAKWNLEEQRAAQELERFLNTDIALADHLEEVLRSGQKIADPLYAELPAEEMITVLKEAKECLQSYKTAALSQNLQAMSSVIARLNNTRFVQAIQKIPFADIATIIALPLDMYEIICFHGEMKREIDNCFKDISAAQAYLANIQALVNNGGECGEALAGYMPECREAVEDLVVDAQDIIRTQKGRFFTRIQTFVVDGALGTFSFLLPKNIDLFANIAAYAVGNVSEAAAYISLIKNMHEMDDDWEEIQRSCIDPLSTVDCSESGGGDGGDGGDGGGGSGPGDDDPYGGGGPDNDNSNGGRPGNDDSNGGRPRVYAPTTPVIDPAGYVYEAVASNRVEGATAQIWYRDGDNEPQLWTEAPEFGEVTTQITGADGRFAWMTPPGKWRVTVTKDGYENANSSSDPAAQDGWLPVPPPQLNVNIPLISRSAPTVESAQAAADVIRVVFSQYMDTAQFADGALLTVTQNGEPVTVTVSFTDREVSPTKANTYYGRVLELRRADGKSFASGVSLTIDQTAKNYAGTELAAQYSSGSLTVQPIPGSITHSYPNRFVTEVGAQGTLAVQVLDTTGKPLAGVTVTAVQQVGGTLELAGTAVSDSNGRASFAVKGLTSGYDTITFSAGTVGKTMNTRVAPLSTTAPQKPTANLTDYQVVSTGTQLVISAQPGATIRYTTNNTCPCTDEALTYTGPITLSENGEYFFRIAAWTEAGGYSERLNLHITVQPGGSGSSGVVIPGGTTPGGTKPVDKPTQEPQFVDVPESAYYYEAVRWAVENGITDGVGNGKFDPNGTCTRAQIVTFLWRAAGCPEPKSMSSFADVPADAYYAKAVAWAVENGITGGVGGGKFAPDQPCTRAQSVTFLYRAAGGPAVSGGADFDDVSAEAYYAAAVAWAAQRSITDGIGGGLFGSELECTRAQIVTFLYRSVK